MPTDWRQWIDPLAWPFPIKLWVGIVVVGYIFKFMQRWWKARTLHWPTAEGRIEDASVEKSSRMSHDGGYQGVLRYSYAANGDTYAGAYTRQFTSEEEADEYVHDLKGRTVMVSWNPLRPSQSTLQENAIALAQAQRPPAPEPDSPPQGAPGFETLVLRLLALCGAIGFTISLGVNVAAWMGKVILPQPFFFIMHVGIFPLWFIMIFVLRRNGRTSRDWKRLLRGAPEWTVNFTYILFGYTFLNFALFMFAAPKKSSGPPQALQWRGFSGHWMLFYFVSAACLYASSNRPSSTNRVSL